MACIAEHLDVREFLALRGACRDTFGLIGTTVVHHVAYDADGTRPGCWLTSTARIHRTYSCPDVFDGSDTVKHARVSYEALRSREIPPFPACSRLTLGPSHMPDYVTTFPPDRVPARLRELCLEFHPEDDPEGVIPLLEAAERVDKLALRGLPRPLSERMRAVLCSHLPRLGTTCLDVSVRRDIGDIACMYARGHNYGDLLSPMVDFDGKYGFFEADDVPDPPGDAPSTLRSLKLMCGEDTRAFEPSDTRVFHPQVPERLIVNRFLAVEGAFAERVEACLAAHASWWDVDEMRERSAIVAGGAVLAAFQSTLAGRAAEWFHGDPWDSTGDVDVFLPIHKSRTGSALRIPMSRLRPGTLVTGSGVVAPGKFHVQFITCHYDEHSDHPLDNDITRGSPHAMILRASDFAYVRAGLRWNVDGTPQLLLTKDFARCMRHGAIVSMIDCDTSVFTFSKRVCPSRVFKAIAKRRGVDVAQTMRPPVDPSVAAHIVAQWGARAYPAGAKPEDPETFVRVACLLGGAARVLDVVADGHVCVQPIDVDSYLREC